MTQDSTEQLTAAGDLTAPKTVKANTASISDCNYDFWQRNTAVLSTGVFIAAAAFSMVAAFLPIFLQDLGLKQGVSVWAGLIFSVTSFTSAIMAPIWGALADRYGKRLMLIRSGAGLAASYLLMGLAQDHIQLFLLRALAGVLSGFIPASIMLVATNTPEKNLPTALGAIQTASAVGSITGPLIGGALAQGFGLRGAFLVSAGFLLAATIISTAMSEEHVVKGAEGLSILGGIREAWSNGALRRMLIALFLVQAGLMVVQPTLPLFIASMTTTNVPLITGVVFSIVGLATAVGAPLAGRQVARHGAERVFVRALWLAAALSGVQAAAFSVWDLTAGRFLFGFANAAVGISGNVLVATVSENESRGRNFGLLNSMTALGAVLGPIVGGIVGEHLGFRFSFLASSILLVIAVTNFLGAGKQPAKQAEGV